MLRRYPSANFGSNATPCFFQQRQEFLSEAYFLVVRFLICMYRITVGTTDALTLNGKLCPKTAPRHSPLAPLTIPPPQKFM